MHPPLKLNLRQQHVLWATVRHYVTTAEPVGSKVVAQEYDLNISPATVRHVMGALEKSGLLFQPHTSAGRVPSDYGYRLYVDHLIHPSQAAARQVDSRLSQTLDWEGWSMEAMLRGAAQILAALSGYLTLITVPQTSTINIRHLHLVRVTTDQVLLVVLLDSLETQSMVIQLPSPVDTDEPWEPDALDRELQILSNFLTVHLQGRSLTEISQLDWNDLGQEFQRYGEALQQAMGALVRRAQSPVTTQFIMSGLSEVLRQPEFATTHQVQAIIHLLEEEQNQLWPLVFEAPAGLGAEQRVRVWIGSENPLEPMQGCALVSATYSKGQVPLGSVSILGPTRMMYEDAIAIVETAADYLSDGFNSVGLSLGSG